MQLERIKLVWLDDIYANDTIQEAPDLRLRVFKSIPRLNHSDIGVNSRKCDKIVILAKFKLSNYAVPCLKKIYTQEDWTAHYTMRIRQNSILFREGNTLIIKVECSVSVLAVDL